MCELFASADSGDVKVSTEDTQMSKYWDIISLSAYVDRDLFMTGCRKFLPEGNSNSINHILGLRSTFGLWGLIG